MVVNAGGINQNNISVLLGDGRGGFSNPLSTPAGGLGSIALTIGDYNHDGKRDVAVVNNITNNVSIMLGNGAGTFRLSGYYPTQQGPVAISTGDFNRDGNCKARRSATQSETSTEIAFPTWRFPMAVLACN